MPPHVTDSPPWPSLGGQSWVGTVAWRNAPVDPPLLIRLRSAGESVRRISVGMLSSTCLFAVVYRDICEPRPCQSGMLQRAVEREERGVFQLPCHLGFLRARAE